jgi:hypothetical protein
MTFWLNRRVERALQSYLQTLCSSTMKIYRSAQLAPRQFPCAVVRAHQNRRYVGEVYAANRMIASVMVMTEYASEIDGNAVEVSKFEEIEEIAVSSVLEALFVDDLAAQLTAVGIPGISISYAAIGSADGDPVTSQSDEDGNVSIVEIPLVIMAGSTEI